MNTGNRLVWILAVALLAGLALAGITGAATGNMPLALQPAHSAQGGAPAIVAYQGEVRVSEEPYTGDGYFKFAVVNAAGDVSYWSNDGTSTVGDEPDSAVALSVSAGIFSVGLGDTTLGGGMTEELTAEVFDQPDRYLRVWFSTGAGGPFDQFTPDTRVAAVPYALQADQAVNADAVDGLHADELRTHYHHVIVVAKSGGDYTSVQAAIDEIVDATADDPYLVWVAPGVYSETVTMKPYVHLQGAGQDVTVITSAITGEWPPAQATLTLVSDASLRDLTVGNSGGGDTNTALLATAGATRTMASDVTASALGNGVNNVAIFVSDSGTGITLERVAGLAENASSLNTGFFNSEGAAATLRGGQYTARGGTYGWAIFNVGSDTTLEAENISTLAENATDHNSAFYSYNGATAVLHGGSFVGRGGNQADGVANAFHSTLTAVGVTALAENGNYNYAMGNYNVATATLSSGVFTARGGENTYALSNELTVTIKAENITAVAEDGSNSNHGLWNVNNARLVLHGASLTGRGGTHAYGAFTSAAGTTLEAEDVAALGEDGSVGSYGLLNSNTASAMLYGGSFTGRGGTTARGIYCHDSGSTLEAEGVTALGEGSSGFNHGLYNIGGATSDVTQSLLAGASGSVYHEAGSTTTISNARLDGTVNDAEVICVLVTRGTTVSTDGTTCP